MCPDAGPRELAVRAVGGGRKQPSLLPVRLIAVPLPPDKVEAMRLKLKHKARKHQDTLDPRTLLAAGCMVPVPRHTESDRLGTRRAWLGEAAIGYGLGPRCEVVARQGRKEFNADTRRRCTQNT
jgi:hypothetical protein